MCRIFNCIYHSATVMGLNNDMLYYTDPEYVMMTKAFGIVRDGYAWWGVEAKKGVFNFSASTYDLRKNNNEKYNVSILMVLAYENPAYTTQRSIDNQTQRDAFERYTRECLIRRSGSGIVWELWNEPDLGFWKPAPNASSYSLLNNQIGQLFQSSYPNETYSGPGLAQTDNYAGRIWLERVYATGGLDYWKLVTLHPYRQRIPEPATEAYIIQRRTIQKYTRTDEIPRQLAVSEWGYSTAWSGINETVQAYYLVRIFMLGAINEIGFTQYYNLRNNGNNTADQEQNFGVVYDYFVNKTGFDPYNPRPGFNAAVVLKNTLKDFTFNKQITTNTIDLTIATQKDWVALFSKLNGDGSSVIVAWSTIDAPHVINVTIGATGTFTVMSIYGDNSTLSTLGSGSSAYLPITVSSSPVYIFLPSSLLTQSDYFAILVATPRLKHSYYTTFDNKTYSINVNLVNPTNQTIKVTIGGESQAALSIPAGETGVLTKAVAGLTSHYSKVFVEVQINGIGSFVMQTISVFSLSFDVQILPTSYTSLQVTTIQGVSRVTNPIVTTVLTDASNTYTNTSTPDFPVDYYGPTSVQTFSASMTPGGDPTRNLSSVSFTYSVNDSTNQVFSMSRNILVFPYTAATISVSNKNYIINVTQVPATTLNPPFNLNIYRVNYTVNTGGSIAYVYPSSVATSILIYRPIDKIVLWVYGDGSGSYVSVRLYDSTNQIIQPVPQAVRTVGWDRMEFNFDISPSIPAETLKYPLRFQAYFAITQFSTGSNPVVNSLLFTPPIVYTY